MGIIGTKEIRKLNTLAKKENFFQPKLDINQPNDIYEQEADAVAEQVMRKESSSFLVILPNHSLNRHPSQQSNGNAITVKKKMIRFKDKKPQLEKKVL